MLASLLTYIGLVFLAMVKPGPGVAFFTSLTLSDGLKSGVIALLGCALSHLLIVLLILQGFDTLKHHTFIIECIQVVSLIFLFFYGVYYFSKASASALIRDFAIASVGIKGSKMKQNLIRFSKGIIWPFTNPFNYVMYGSLLPVLAINPEFFTWNMKLLLACITGGLVFSGIFPYLVLADKVIKYLKGNAIVGNMNKITGALCIAIVLGFLPGLVISLQPKIIALFGI